MLRADRIHAAWVPAIIAFAAAALALLALQLAAAAALAVDGLVEALWITGWVLASWALIAGIGAGALLGRRGGIGTRSARGSIALVVTTAVMLALLVALHPPIGIGGGVG